MVCVKWLVSLALLVAVAGLVGCANSSSPTVSGPSAEGAAYVLAAEPSSAKGVKEVKAGAKDTEDVTLFGRIGGDANPWIEGQAAFLIVDSSLEPCGADEGCPTPWDYCCAADSLPEAKAMVKIVDAGGNPVATDARKLLGLKELQTVVVQGKAKRDEAGNLTVLASGVFVRK
jgi:hypothetical protein